MHIRNNTIRDTVGQLVKEVCNGIYSGQKSLFFPRPNPYFFLNFLWRVQHFYYEMRKMRGSAEILTLKCVKIGENKGKWCFRKK